MGRKDINGNPIDPMTAEEIDAVRRFAMLNGRNPNEDVASAEGFRTADRERLEFADLVWAERNLFNEKMQKEMEAATAAGKARQADQAKMEAERKAAQDRRMADPNQNPFVNRR